MKKKVAAFGFEYLKIHVCKNNCILFYKEFEALEYCSVCGHPRYKSNNSGRGKVSKIFLSRFCIISFLFLGFNPRFFILKNVAKNMTWHAYN